MINFIECHKLITGLPGGGVTTGKIWPGAIVIKGSKAFVPIIERICKHMTNTTFKYILLIIN